MQPAAVAGIGGEPLGDLFQELRPDIIAAAQDEGIVSIFVPYAYSGDWERLLLEKGVPCGGVKDYLSFLNDPQVAAMEMNPIVEHPLIGPMRMAGVPITFDKTPGGIQRPAPVLGQHTDEILRGLGFDEERIAKLRTDRVIHQNVLTDC